MLERIHRQIGTAGLVVAIIALVAALGGGAYAASGSDSGGKATASKAKAKQGKQGKPGKPGPAGPAGPQGPAGPAGAKGDAGAAGSNGTNGTAGAPGQSVTGAPIAAGGACGEGVTGVKYTLNSTPTNVCNGKDGQSGFTDTLPSNKTETGVWSASMPAGKLGFVSSSFNIPLGSDLSSSNVIFVPEGKEEEFETECPGSAESPKAAPGFACFFTLLAPNNPFIVNGPYAGRTGVTFALLGEAEAEGFAFGTWAVTAPTAP